MVIEISEIIKSLSGFFLIKTTIKNNDNNKDKKEKVLYKNNVGKFKIVVCKKERAKKITAIGNFVF